MIKHKPFGTGVVTAVLALVALAFVLVVQGAIPFVADPTLGQALWTTGFAQSFANQSLLGLHATNMGYPHPAAIAFGLAGAYPTAWFIALGFDPADAYAAMSAFWFSVAYLGAWFLARDIGLSPRLGIAAALVWMTQPMIWFHTRYSMLAFGIALLPAYLWVAGRCFEGAATTSSRWRHALLYLVACIVAVFMDGYTFVMFAVGASLLYAYRFIAQPDQRRTLLCWGAPVHIVGFGMAYGLYALYVGASHFDKAPLDFFRGWGVDLSFWAIPTTGVHGLWDALGLTVERSSRQFYGDGSVWVPTFLLPLLLAGAAGAWRLRRRSRAFPAGALLLVTLAGLYLALGPSLKVDTTRPPDDEQLASHMSAEQALAPTGSAWLSTYLPGFNNMRAAYRWQALAVCGLWVLMLGLLIGLPRHQRPWGYLLCGVLVAMYLPNLAQCWHGAIENRAAIEDIDKRLVGDLAERVSPGEVVAFLPYRNDFLATYLAPRLGVQAYNIGGDKNLAQAREHWPPAMQVFHQAAVGERFPEQILTLLTLGEADAVILPYLDLLWAAHIWPSPLNFEASMNDIARRLEQTGKVDAEYRPYYVLVRLEPDEREKPVEARIASLVDDYCLPPVCLQHDIAGQSDTPTQVGRLENGRLSTIGQPGFLAFGPYQPMRQGTYRLTLEGSTTSAPGAWVDVVSGKGTVSHARFPIAPADGSHQGTLIDETIVLKTDVDDLEIRVHVETDDKMTLTGYRLAPSAE